MLSCIVIAEINEMLGLCMPIVDTYVGIWLCSVIWSDREQVLQIRWHALLTGFVSGFA